jgi:ADP-ribosylglycohydrolase
MSDQVFGCLLGGAVGDALGAPVEFMSLARIREKFGPAGVKTFHAAYGRTGAVTDDTQMTLFTAEGLLRAWVRGDERGLANPAAVVHHAYLRWLLTQGERSAYRNYYQAPEFPDGWLISVPELHARRAPGGTCLGGLRANRLGTMAEPLNNSKGCGGVMRAAPVGLMFDRPEAAFRLGCEIAALTHGHPTGFLAAGFLAAMVARIRAGASLPAAIDAARDILVRYPNHEECREAVDKALALAREPAPSPESVERLGAGWIAEEALAMSLYCALAARDDFVAGVLLAVNHSGDSDSTGAITGNILSALLGKKAIPPRWLAELELRQVIEVLSEDLISKYREDDPGWCKKYPGW